ncbi:MAG TPA: hypothetical protein VFC43_08250 [Methanoregula sp.]|nr:hypothetical protein [Methanoregula sp.]
MNECLTIDYEDEEDHRWFFSCRNPDQNSDTRTPADGDEIFFVNFYSDIIFLVHSVEKQVLFAISQKPDFRAVSG